MNMVLLFFWLSCEDYGKPIEYGTLVKMESKPESCRNKIILLLLETGLEIKLTPKVVNLIPLSFQSLRTEIPLDQPTQKSQGFDLERRSFRTRLHD